LLRGGILLQRTRYRFLSSKLIAAATKVSPDGLGAAKMRLYS
jgi:hypothetical protein